MAKKTITIEYTWEEIMALIEKDAIEKLTLKRFEVKSSGDHDRGDYKEWLTKFTFEVKAEI